MSANGKLITARRPLALLANTKIIFFVISVRDFKIVDFN